MKYYYIIILYILYSCNQNNVKKDIISRNGDIEQQANVDSLKSVLSDTVEFVEKTSTYFDANQVYGITIDMKIDKALKKMKEKEFTFEEVNSNDWGFGGGSKSWLIKKNGEEMLVLIPDFISHRLKYIIILNPIFSLNNGLKINMSVKDYLTVYPNSIFSVNLMNDYEESYNDKLMFIFLTNDNNRIGIYEEIESSSKAINKKNAVINRIILGDFSGR